VGTEGSGLTVRAEGGASRWKHAFALANEPMYAGSVPNFREEQKKSPPVTADFLVTLDTLA
jgi:hypothetical protein